MKETAGDTIVLHICSRNHNHMRYSSWAREWHRQKFLSFSVIFVKMKISSFYTCERKITFIMLPQIWSATNIISCYFGSIFTLLPYYWHQELKLWKNVKKSWRYFPFRHVHHEWRSYDVWFLIYKAQRTEFFVILSHFFLSFDQPNNPENQNFEKMKNFLNILSFYPYIP